MGMTMIPCTFAGDTIHEILLFESIGAGTSGVVTAPYGATIRLDSWAAGVDAVLSQMAGGRPNFRTPLTAGGVGITTTFDIGGNYNFSGIPVAYPVALIYVVRVTLDDYSQWTAADLDGILEISDLHDLPAPTAGAVPYGNAEPRWISLPIGGVGTVLTSTGAMPQWAAPGAPAAHNMLSIPHGDSTPAAAIRGDIITSQGVAPTWSSLAIAVPAANVRNVLGVDNGDTESAWKTALDNVNPTTITPGAAGGPGTSLIFAHRDHDHPAPATYPATAHNLLSAIHGDSTVAACVRGDIITGQGVAPTWTALAIAAPAATFMNYLGVANADTEPGYKALFDAVVPTTIAESDVAATGAAVVAARRDHVHGAPATWAATAHNLLSATHGDTVADAVVDGDVVIGNVTPAWTRLAISVPAANVRNVFGVDNAELRPSWKTALDNVNPTTITPGAAGGPGTSLVFAHRDHDHPAPATYPATAHNVLSATHGDSAAAAVVDGDVIIGNATPAWSKLAISIPAANVRNVLGIDNGELRPSWKTALDNTNPTTITPGAAGGPGTSLLFSHRDHDHPAPATYPATAHNLLSATHGDTTVGASVQGDIVVGVAGPTWSKLALGGAAGSFLRRDATDPLWSMLILPNAATQGDILVATGANTIGSLVDVAAGQPLLSGGIGTVPAYAGWTLAGTAAQTYTLGSTGGTVPTAAGTLTVATANAVSAAGVITHAITSSSNPGAAASLLATDASGYLQLVGLGIGAAAGAANRITMADGATIGQAAGPLVAFDDTNNYLEITGCNVGIGTSTPANKLEISGTGNVAQYITTTTAGGVYSVYRTTSGTPNINAFGLVAGSTGVFDLRAFTDVIGDKYYFIRADSVTGNLYLQPVSGNVGIGITAPTAKTHIDQSSTTAAIPVLTLDQADVSEQAIKVSYDGADVDMRLMTLDVTGTPEFGWDESEDSFTFNKSIRSDGQVVAANVGYAVSDALLHLPFNGGTPNETNFQVDVTGHLGQVGTVAGGVIGRPGKFNKGVQVAEGTTNYTLDPVVGFGDTSKFTIAAGITGAVSTDYVRFGSSSLKLTATVANRYVYSNTTYWYETGGSPVWCAGDDMTASVWVYIPTGVTASHVSLDIYENTGGGYVRVGHVTATTNDTWERLVVTHSVDAGATDIWFRLGFVADSGSFYTDGWQLEALGYATPVCAGNMGAGHSWSGTAHNSTSTRTAAELDYDDYVTDVIQPQGGVSGWWTVGTVPSDSGSPHVIFDARGADNNNRLVIFAASDDKIDLYINGVACATNIGSGSLSHGDHIFVLAGWDFDANNYALYVYDGTTWYSGTDATSLTFPTLTQLSIGSNYGAGERLNGVLDDICFYDHMPTEDEAHQIGESDAPLVVGNGNHSLLLGGDVQSRVVGNDRGLFHYDDAGNERLAVVADDVTWGGESLTSGDVAIGDPAVASILADQSDGIIKVRQSSTTAAIPALLVSQLDVSEEIFEFTSTVGVGNAIEAVGAKTLTTTHFIKCTITGVGTVYFPVGTIA